MIELLIQYKWYVLLFAEILAWTSTICMFMARYWWESKVGFRISFVLSLVTGIGIQLCITFVNIFNGKNKGFFEIVVGLLIIYGITYGKKHVKVLDRMVLNWARKKRSVHFK